MNDFLFHRHLWRSQVAKGKESKSDSHSSDERNGSNVRNRRISYARISCLSYIQYLRLDWHAESEPTVISASSHHTGTTYRFLFLANLKKKRVTVARYGNP